MPEKRHPVVRYWFVLTGLLVCSGLLTGAADGFGTHAARHSTLKPRADLSISLNSSLDRVTVGNELVYTIKVTNKGPATATNAKLTLPIPPGTTFEGAFPYGLLRCGRASPGALPTCTLPPIPPPPPPDQSITFTGPSPENEFVVTVVVGTKQVGTLNASASVALRGDPRRSNNAATTTTAVVPGLPSADLSVSIASTPARVTIWDEVHYTVTITNHGPTEATLVQLTDFLSEGLYPTSISGASDEGYFCLGSYPAGGFPTCWPSLAVGQSVTLEITAEPSVHAQGSLGSIGVVSSRTPDPTMENNLARTETELIPFLPVPGVDLAIDLHASPDPVSVGGDLLYTMNIRNLGAERAMDIHLSVKTSSAVDFYGVGFSSNSADGNGAGCAFPNNECTVDHLGSGERVTITFTGNPNTAGPLTGTAVVGSAVPDANPSDNTATATVTVKAK
jgi:uncharacterized repeat protein (TIGR01451 family)